MALLQRDVAERIGASTATVTNWELNRTNPVLRFLPAIVRFLGYPPWPADGSIGARLLAYRRERGLSQTTLARLLAVDPGMLSRWEREVRVPAGAYARRITRWLTTFTAGPNSPPHESNAANASTRPI